MRIKMNKKMMASEILELKREIKALNEKMEYIEKEKLYNKALKNIRMIKNLRLKERFLYESFSVNSSLHPKTPVWYASEICSKYLSIRTISDFLRVIDEYGIELQNKENIKKLYDKTEEYLEKQELIKEMRED